MQSSLSFINFFFGSLDLARTDGDSLRRSERTPARIVYLGLLSRKVWAAMAMSEAASQPRLAGPDASGSLGLEAGGNLGHQPSFAGARNDLF